MNYRKGILWLSILLGAVAGGYLSATYSDFAFGGAVVGGLLGCLVYYLISWAVSLRIKSVLPYDSLDDHQQVHSNMNTQGERARYTGMQDALMDDVMRFPPKFH